MFKYFFLIISALILVNSSHADKKNSVEELLNKANVNKKNVGIYVYDLTGKTPVYSLNEDKFFSIASVNKLFITAAAIKILGHDFRFKTSIYGTSPDKDGIMNKTLYIKGGGDPLFVSESMWYLVNRLAAIGVNTIESDIVLDDTLFPATEIYEEGSDRSYSAKISSLSVNFNSIALSIVSGLHTSFIIDPPLGDYKIIDKTKRSSLVTDANINRSGKQVTVFGNVNNSVYANRWIYRNIEDPFSYFAQVLRLHLKWRGIDLKGNIINGSTPRSETVLFDVESRRLSEILMEMNKFSNNFIAEQTMRALACKVSLKKCDVNDAVTAVLDYITETGLDKNDFNIVNASGFSMSNRSRPKSFVKFLEKVYDDFEIAPEFINSLSIAGVDGTVRRSINQKEFGKGRLRAKTGTLTGVRSLAGYFYSDKHTYAFIIVANDPNAHKLLDYEGKILQNIK